MKRGPKPINRSGKTPGTRHCIACESDQRIENFYKDKNRPDGLYPECKSCVNKRRMTAYHSNQSASQAAQRKYTRKIRDEVLDHYGGECACCGENNYEFLAIDHIHGGGKRHRMKVIGTAKSFIGWLRRSGYPEGFRVLCHNCNNSLGWYGYCPHGNPNIKAPDGSQEHIYEGIVTPKRKQRAYPLEYAMRQFNATEWLKNFLLHPQKATGVWSRAKARGHSIRQVKVAARELGVIKSSSSSLSVWSLPSSAPEGISPSPSRTPA